MMRIGIVQSHKLKLLTLYGYDSVLVFKHFNRSFAKRLCYTLRIIPVIVIAKHRKGWRVKFAHQKGQIVQK